MMAERGSQTINRAFSILDCFTLEQPNVSLTELSERTGLTLPTCHRMIRALQANGYLIQSPTDNHYSLGPRVVELARIVLQRNEQNELVAIAFPYLEHLRSVTTETVGLHVPMERQRICVAEFTSRHPMRMATGVGHMYPLYAGAAGKAMLANMPYPQREDILVSMQELTSPGIPVPDVRRLETDLDKVRARGYSVSFGETVSGAGAIAVPIRSVHGVVLASINVTGPLTRFSEANMFAALPELTSAAADIERELGNRPASVASR